MVDDRSTVNESLDCPELPVWQRDFHPFPPINQHPPRAAQTRRDCLHRHRTTSAHQSGLHNCYRLSWEKRNSVPHDQGRHHCLRQRGRRHPWLRSPSNCPFQLGTGNENSASSEECLPAVHFGVGKGTFCLFELCPIRTMDVPRKDRGRREERGTKATLPPWSRLARQKGDDSSEIFWSSVQCFAAINGMAIVFGSNRPCSVKFFYVKQIKLDCCV